MQKRGRDGPQEAYNGEKYQKSDYNRIAVQSSVQYYCFVVYKSYQKGSERHSF